MNLRDYRWFYNPRGLHNISIGQDIQMYRYTYPRLGWAKLVTVGDEYIKPRPGTGISMVQEFMNNEIMPIMRFYRGNFAGEPIENDPKQFDWWGTIYPEYIRQGCLWFEFYNEPNLDGEWPNGGWDMWISWDNRELIAKLMDNWLGWAEGIVSLGGYPGFIALTDSAHEKAATVLWLDQMLSYLKERHESRFRRIIGSGLWCATHPYIANHFYQQRPGGSSWSARQPHEVNCDEEGWHFEYPYDPRQQRDDPGRTVFGGTALTPRGDPNGLIASGLAFQQLLWKYFHAGPVPVVGTEGGIWRIPTPVDPPHIIDDRYPGYTWDSTGHATVALYRWVAKHAPPWFWGLTTWMETDWYDINGEVPAVGLLADRAPVLKYVPNMPVRTG